MSRHENIVARFVNGRILKGHTKNFTNHLDTLVLTDAETREEHRVPIEELKAIFFVKSFEGRSKHREKKSFGIGKKTGRRVYIKFKDGESLVGFLEGDVPWEKGFHLSKQDGKAKGFFLIPVDSDCNNTMVFVVGKAIKDITTFP